MPVKRNHSRSIPLHRGKTFLQEELKAMFAALEQP